MLVIQVEQEESKDRGLWTALDCFLWLESIDKLPTPVSKWKHLCGEPVGWTANHLHLHSLMVQVMLGEFSMSFSLRRLINVFNFILPTKCRFSCISQWHLDYEQSHKSRTFEWSCKNILLVQQSSKEFSQATPLPVGAYLRYCGRETLWKRICSWRLLWLTLRPGRTEPFRQCSNKCVMNTNDRVDQKLLVMVLAQDPLNLVRLFLLCFFVWWIHLAPLVLDLWWLEGKWELCITKDFHVGWPTCLVVISETWETGTSR